MNIYPPKLTHISQEKFGRSQILPDARDTIDDIHRIGYIHDRRLRYANSFVDPSSDNKMYVNRSR